jgi:hypothetical protein
MEGVIISHRVRVCLLAAVLALLAAAGAGPVQARPIPPNPTVELGSVARLAPDGQSLDVDVAASCPDRWTVVEATVGVTQGQASGQAPFTLSCTGGLQLLTVTVHSSGAAFQLADAQATATLRIQRGRTLEAQDSEVVRVLPNVVVRLADTGILVGGGASALVDVTVACAAGPTGQQSYVTLTQGPTTGQGTFVPVCDGQQHTFNVSVQATQGLFQNNFALGNAFVTVDHEGDLIFGEDNRYVLIGGCC